MRLFTFCKHCSNKIHISNDAKIRSDLPFKFYLKCPYCHNKSTYFPADVNAEISNINIVGGALVGGLIGLLGGGVGAIIGATLGSIIGGGSEKSDNEAVTRFNTS